MKKILKMTAILLILAGFVSCGENNRGEDNNETYESGPLEGTKWKFVGFIDVQTGILEEVVPRRGQFDIKTGILTDGDPIDCEKCYTLSFTSDTTAQGWSMLNEIYVKFFDPIRRSSTNISFSKKPVRGGTEIGESPGPTLYTNALIDLTAYIYYNNELKLFYNNNKNYLLFKLVES
jgi:hypothetical protein